MEWDVLVTGLWNARWVDCLLILCRRNCKGNPNCLIGIGEHLWLGDIDENTFHNIDDPSSERRDKVLTVFTIFWNPSSYFLWLWPLMMYLKTHYHVFQQLWQLFMYVIVNIWNILSFVESWSVVKKKVLIWTLCFIVICSCVPFQNTFVGLTNLGATCYVNTFLQVWFHNLELRQTLYLCQNAWVESADSG